MLIGERCLSAAPGVPPTSARPRMTLYKPSEPGDDVDDDDGGGGGDNDDDDDNTDDGNHDVS